MARGQDPRAPGRAGRMSAAHRPDNGRARRTHCPRGHALVAGNLEARRGGHRSCLTCANAVLARSPLRRSQQARVLMRAFLLERDGNACHRCGDPIDPPEVPSIGHDIAVADGGPDEPWNLWLEHLRCNQRAGTKRAGNPRSRPILYSGEISTMEPTVASNGARSRRLRPSVVRYAPMPPDAPRIDGDGR
jgi:5-methylcytosine-specific restriction endonuclease McrA